MEVPEEVPEEVSEKISKLPLKLRKGTGSLLHCCSFGHVHQVLPQCTWWFSGGSKAKCPMVAKDWCINSSIATTDSAASLLANFFMSPSPHSQTTGNNFEDRKSGCRDFSGQSGDCAERVSKFQILVVQTINL